jgi:hypothetical protein
VCYHEWHGARSLQQLPKGPIGYIKGRELEVVWDKLGEARSISISILDIKVDHSTWVIKQL